VWNPPPFEPVEGAGFLWVLVLWAIWGLTGFEPPVAANPFSIACGLVQVLLLAAAAQRLRGREGGRVPMVVGLVALAVIVGNRTFLQWLTSGLDTALFNMWLLWWVLHAFRGPGRCDGRWLLQWSLAAALAALTRPDGLPLVCATAGVACWLAWRGRLAWRATSVGLTPLLLVVGLTLWRRAYYGDWLPNTYFAKVVSAWPEAGARYFACFALENGAWLWFLVLAVWLVVELRRPLAAVVGALLDHVPALAAVAVVAFNACYYLFKVGGDHFEYRVLSQLVPLGTLACVAMAARVGGGILLPVATAVGLGLAGSVGWVHLAITRDPAFFGVKAITPSLPSFVQPLARWFDRQQLWLFVRYVGLRCTHHELVLRVYAANYPERRWVATPAEPLPALATGAVGLPSYYLPDCVIIDSFGLNDWVIARTPSGLRSPVAAEAVARAVEGADGDRDGFLGLDELRRAFAVAFGTDPNDTAGDFVLRFLIASQATERQGALSTSAAAELGALLDAPRRMAHERVPPPGYVEAFDPNVTVVDGVVTVRPRAVPLTAERVRAIEAEWRDKVRRGALPR
jgi:arabinofuranosyltransferase